jgi:hypothetical protein
MSNEHIEDPVASPVQDLLTIFSKDLSAVAFPDVSSEMLGSLAQKVRTCSKDLSDALARAQAARESLEAGQTELLAKAARGLAYARVFAEGNQELLEKLNGINLGKPGRTSRKNAAEKPKDEKSVAEAPQADQPKTEDKKPAKTSKRVTE